MVLQGVRHPVSYIGLCYTDDPKLGGYKTPMRALDLTTSFRGELMETRVPLWGGVGGGSKFLCAWWPLCVEFDPGHAQFLSCSWTPNQWWGLGSEHRVPQGALPSPVRMFSGWHAAAENHLTEVVRSKPRNRMYGKVPHTPPLHTLSPGVELLV